jgi:hypothetical protein
MDRGPDGETARLADGQPPRGSGNVPLQAPAGQLANPGVLRQTQQRLSVRSEREGPDRAGVVRQTRLDVPTADLVEARGLAGRDDHATIGVKGRDRIVAVRIGDGPVGDELATLDLHSRT